MSERDRKDLKRARQEGRLAEAMLDRRAALKRYVLPPSQADSDAGRRADGQ